MTVPINGGAGEWITILCAQLFSLHRIFLSWRALYVTWDKNLAALRANEVL